MNIVPKDLKILQFSIVIGFPGHEFGFKHHGEKPNLTSVQFLGNEHLLPTKKMEIKIEAKWIRGEWSSKWDSKKEASPILLFLFVQNELRCGPGSKDQNCF